MCLRCVRVQEEYTQRLLYQSTLKIAELQKEAELLLDRHEELIRTRPDLLHALEPELEVIKAAQAALQAAEVRTRCTFRDCACSAFVIWFQKRERYVHLPLGTVSRCVILPVFVLCRQNCVLQSCTTLTPVPVRLPLCTRRQRFQVT